MAHWRKRRSEDPTGIILVFLAATFLAMVVLVIR